MDVVERRNRERIASSHVGGAGNRDRLVAVVHVLRFASTSSRSRLRNVVVDGSVKRRDGQASAAKLCSLAVSVVHLERLKARHRANVSLLIGRVGLGVAERARQSRQVVRHAVVVTRGQRQVAVELRHAAFVHQRVGLCHIVKARGSGRALHNERTLKGGDVVDGDVDVGRELLLCASTKATFLQGIAQFGCGQHPRHRLAEAERGGNRQLRVVLEVGGHVSAGEGLHDVRLGTPDDVVGTLHLGAVRVVQRDVARQN